MGVEGIEGISRMSKKGERETREAFGGVAVEEKFGTERSDSNRSEQKLVVPES